MNQLPAPPDIHALLKRIEWAGYNGMDCCPECGGPAYDTFAKGHREDCELAKAIEWTTPSSGFASANLSDLDLTMFNPVIATHWSADDE